MYNSSITMEVLTSNGNPITEYNKDGDTYIEGRKGSEFSVRIHNKSGSRVHAILSIDGLDVLDGKKASYESRGYIISPYGSVAIEGWRITTETIKKFFFTRQNNTYSKKSGEGTSNLGVIGLAVFKEKVKHITPFYGHTQIKTFGNKIGTSGGHTNSSYTTNDSYQAGSGMGASVNYVDQNVDGATLHRSPTAKNSSAPIGTGMGQEQESHINLVYFDQEQHPFSVMQLFYKERKELERMGVIRIPIKSKRQQKPTAFPGQFCKEV